MQYGKYDSNWLLETIDRVLILNDPEAEELWDIIEKLSEIIDGRRDMADELVVPGRDFTPEEEQTFNTTAEKLITLLNRLEK